LDFAPLQSLARTGPPALPRSLARRDLDRLPLLGFFSPTALEVSGSDLCRGCLPRLRCAFRLSQPLDAFFPPIPFRLCFTPVTLLGFTLQRFPLPSRRVCLSTSRPSWRSCRLHCQARYFLVGGPQSAACSVVPWVACVAFSRRAVRPSCVQALWTCLQGFRLWTEVRSSDLRG
jgi:hypothetical protein